MRRLESEGLQFIYKLVSISINDRKENAVNFIMSSGTKKILFLQSSLSYLWGKEYVFGFCGELGKRAEEQ